MKTARNHKKKLIVSYEKLSDELKELFKEAYPDGYKDHLQRTEKPNGEPIFCAPLETEDTTYMVKFEVKIDSGFVEDELDKDMYGDEDKELEFDTLDAVDKDPDMTDHTVHNLHHGDYEDTLITPKAIAKNEELSKELKEAFGDEDYDEDEFKDDIDVDDPDEEDFDEPSEEDIKDIEDSFYVPLDDTDIPEEEMVKIEAPRKRGRKKKGE